MSNHKQTKDNFIAQAGILAAAGFISRIIGLLYRGPLNSVLGEAGTSCYTEAHNFYNIALLLSSYSIPAAISKVIAQKLAMKEYRNAHRFYYCAMGYVLVVGSIASSIMFFLPNLFVTENAVPVLRVFAPTILASGVLGVMRGYFQAHKSTIQTSVSQIFEQIANACISVGMAYFLIVNVFGEVQIPDETWSEALSSRYITLGAMGSAIGTGAGVLMALLVMLFFCLINRGIIFRRIRRDQHEKVDSYPEMILMITHVISPFILSTAIYNLNDSILTYVYKKWIPAIRELDSFVQEVNWGIFSGLAMTVYRIPITVATAMAAAVIPTITLSVVKGEYEEAKEKIASATKTTMLISIPAAVGLFALAEPVIGFVFPRRTDEVYKKAAVLLMILVGSTIFYALSTLSNSVLQALGRMKVPVVNAAIALVIQVGISVAMLLWTNFDCFGLAIGYVIYSIVMFGLNQRVLYKTIGYRIDLKGCFFGPFVSAAVMGVFAKAVYELFYLLIEDKRVALIPAIVMAVFVYFVVLMMMHAVTEEELRSFPKGQLIVKLAKKAKLLR